MAGGGDGLVSPASARFIELEHRYGAHNYHPLPVVLTRGLGEAAAAVRASRVTSHLRTPPPPAMTAFYCL